MKLLQDFEESKMKTVNEYLKLDYEIVLRTLTEDEGGSWFAYYKDFKGVMGDGETPEEALKDARNAFTTFVQNALENGDKIPMPITSTKSHWA